MKLRDLCDIEAEGRNPYPFINAVRESPILCTEQHCKGNIFFCRILSRDLAEFRQLADAYAIRLTVTRHRSLQRRLKAYRLRIGLAAGILLGGMLIFYQSNVVQTIEVQGNTAVPASTITALLEQEGIRQGVWIASLDLTHCERRLRAAVPELAWVGIRHTGSRLVVEVTERKPKPEMLSEHTPCNIVSARDAQITDVQVYSGRLCRLIGDGVAKGDLIVSGVLEDKNGRTFYRHANAKITGIYTREAELTEYFTQRTTEETGRITKQRYLRLFGLRLPLPSGHPTYESSHVTETDTPFTFLGAELPCGIFQRTIAETTVTDITRTEEETKLALHAAIVRYEKNILSDVTILDRRLEYHTGADGITCRMYYRVEGEIGQTADFYLDLEDPAPTEKEQDSQ